MEFVDVEVVDVEVEVVDVEVVDVELDAEVSRGLRVGRIL